MSRREHQPMNGFKLPTPIAKVLLDKIVRPTPIISFVSVSLYTDGMTEELVIHVVSDGGEADRVIEYLARKSADDLLEAIVEANLPVDDVVFIHTGPKDEAPPATSELVYRRDI